MHVDLVPNIDLDFAYKDKISGEVVVVRDTITPLKRYPRSRYEKLYEIGSVSVSAIKKVYEANHNKIPPNASVQLSLDGVSETKSTAISLDVYSLRFLGCRDVYPVRIIRPIVKNQVDHQEQFALVLNSISANNLKLHSVVADNPKRSFLLSRMQHSARYGCEYCFGCGVLFQNIREDHNSDIVKKLSQQRKDITEQLQNLDQDKDKDQCSYLKSILENLSEAEKMSKAPKKHSHIVWPASTMNCEPRTKEKIVDICEQIEAGNELTPAQAKGIKGRSLLLNIEYFDFVGAVPTEYMHLVSLGSVKRLLELCFSVGENRSRIIKRPLTHPDIFNELMKDIKMFKEFARRARNLDLSVLKAQELRNLLIFFFPIITKCLDKNEKEIKVWEMFAFMIRACILPENEFQSVNVNQITYCQKHFYQSYEQLYGPKNCTYSIHVVSSHLQQMRSLGPLTETSAFCFESFYAELRRSFQPGTTSVVKQMFQSVFLKRQLCKHVCEEKIYLREKDTAMESNCLIYVYENNKHVIYKIKTIDNENLICNQLGNLEVEFTNTPMLNWSSVGVYRKGGLSSVDVNISRNAVAGKVIKVDKYLITCPNNILREK